MASEQIDNVSKVPGVLKVNEDTREEMLRRIYWKDRQYLQYAAGLTDYVGIKDRSVSPLTEGKPLVEFTHDGKSDFSEDINRKYDTFIENAYEVKPLEGELHMWEGDYFENFDERNRLSEVADFKFAQGMTFMNYANHDRHVTEKYLTPALSKFYGTSPVTEGDIRRFSIFSKQGLQDAYDTLSGQYKRSSGRIPDIAEAQVASIVHDYVAGEPDESNGGNYFLEEQLNNPDNAGRYTPDKIDGNGNRYSEEKISDNIGINGTFKKYQYDRLNESKHNEYDEGDVSPYNLGYDESADYSQIRTLDNKEGVVVNTSFNGNNLLTKTNELFKRHKISTLVGRFHTSSEVSHLRTIIDTALDYTYGNSHGRNLLTKDAREGKGAQITNGYSNPYCRVWTYHHQYDRVNKLIRPFTDGDAEKTIDGIQLINKDIRAHSSLNSNGDTLNGGKYLAENTVLGKSGFVNIVPSNDIDNTVNIKRCMFSIENLAWKDVLKSDANLSAEQRGPNGGRIMWFPPYDLDFQENITVDWDSNDFIGRGEKVYTYKNTARTGTLSFTLLIDHPGVIDTIKNKTRYGSEEEDYQAILRFFAGCDTLEDWVDEDITEEVTIEKDGNSDEGREVPSDGTTKLIKFYVYYPNNYSGNHKQITKAEWDRIGSSDEDWYYYLLLGSGTTLDPYIWNGYETPAYNVGEESKGGLGKAIPGTEIKPNPYSKKCYQWQVREETVSGGPYNYRVDFDLRQPLVYQKNYIDNATFSLNTVVNPAVSVGATNSFAEVIAAIIGKEKGESGFNIDENDLITQLRLNTERVEELKKVFSSKIYSINVKGAATKQDSGQREGCAITNDTMLAKRRAKSIGMLLKNILLKGGENSDATYSDSEIIEISKLNNMTDTNTLEAKAQRYAVVEIEYNPAEITKLSEANNEENNEESNVIASNNESTITFSDGEAEGAITEPSVVTFEREKKEVVPSTEKIVVTKSIDFKKLRYETEAEYFDKLSTRDPFTFENLKKRFKYFTPAFHSLSPEGFNARLTFLQQCTRQGHTIESSANINGYRKTAGNLAFGRMPVCVLRLGDFINTRILINNVTINYQKDGMQWDLNPEGAGVQPMFATVSLGIVILGGQSLTGPISRLQNAVSFNYYANTGVYDDRADRMEIDANGKEKYTHVWAPTPVPGTSNTETKVEENKK